MRRNDGQSVIFPAIILPELCIAYPDRVLQHGCKHGLKITW